MQDIKIKDQTPHCSKHVLPLVVGGLTITCEDNMQLMSRYPDNYFDLAIVDPPYGLGNKTTQGGSKRNSNANFKSHEWDNSIPSKEYFKELKRVSKNYIVWGGNYMLEHLSNCRCFITWDKMVFIPTMSRVELALTSFDKLPELVQINNTDPNRTHPTQKPVALYKWILDKYAKENDKILDTHLGSGSIAIACHDYKFDLTACELDEEYFEKAKQRIINHVAQQSLF
jgi:site-specific DNA-methyltransferase (adenine-specific)